MFNKTFPLVTINFPTRLHHHYVILYVNVDCAHIYRKRSDERKSKKDLSGTYTSSCCSPE